MENEQNFNDLGYCDKIINTLNSGMLTDCSFCVGAIGKEIFAHKFVLAFSSPVFEKMLYNKHEYAETKSVYKIPLDDIEPEEFSTFLRHIYLTQDNKLIVEDSIAQLKTSYHLADRFRIYDLKGKLYGEIESRIKADCSQALAVFEFGSETHDYELMEQCVEVLSYKGQEEIEPLSIYKLSASVFYDLLKKTKYVWTEVDRFKLLDSYAEFNRICRNYELTTTDTVNVKNDGMELASAENASHALNDVVAEDSDEERPNGIKGKSTKTYIVDAMLKTINLQQLTLKEFCERPIRSALLADAEKLNIVKMLSKEIEIIIKEKDENINRLSKGYCVKCGKAVKLTP